MASGGLRYPYSSCKGLNDVNSDPGSDNGLNEGRRGKVGNLLNLDKRTGVDEDNITRPQFEVYLFGIQNAVGVHSDFLRVVEGTAQDHDTSLVATGSVAA